MNRDGPCRKRCGRCAAWGKRVFGSAGLKRRPRRIPAPRSGCCLATQAELLDQGLVALDVLALEVVEEAATTVDHHQQATTAVVVLLVRLEMAGQLLDACREERDLDFRGTGVVVATLVLADDLCGIDGHETTSG